MPAVQPHRSLQLVITEPRDGTIAVLLKGNSHQSQRVTYELKTSGTSTSTHKGMTSLRAMEPTVVSTVRFSVGQEWCVLLNVEEGTGEQYTIRGGSSCQ